MYAARPERGAGASERAGDHEEVARTRARRPGIRSDRPTAVTVTTSCAASVVSPPATRTPASAIPS